jgi:hypothetical protein
MSAHLTLFVEIALIVLLSATLAYCMVLERRLAAVRKGQDALKGTIGDLNKAISAAGTSLNLLKSTAGGAAQALDERIANARSMIDELSLLTSSGERIADRFDRAVAPKAAPTAVKRNSQLPSGSVMGRLDALKAAAR